MPTGNRPTNGFLISLLVLTLLVMAAPRPAHAQQQAASASHPSLDVTTLDGQNWQLAEQRGKWVLVNFWATWCGPCIAEMPAINEFAHAHDNVVAIGLAFQDAEPDAIKAFLAEHPVRYPIALVDPLSPPADFATPRGLPTSYLINPQGAVAKHFVGPVSKQDLAAAMGIKPPAS